MKLVNETINVDKNCAFIGAYLCIVA